MDLMGLQKSALFELNEAYRDAQTGKPLRILDAGHLPHHHPDRDPVSQLPDCLLNERCFSGPRDPHHIEHFNTPAIKNLFILLRPQCLGGEFIIDHFDKRHTCLRDIDLKRWPGMIGMPSPLPSLLFNSQQKFPS